MIVRIIGEGQFRLDDRLVNDLNALDAGLQSDLQADNAHHFSYVLQEMIKLVRSHGTPLADYLIERSDAILPPEYATLAEIREMLREDGLIPG